MGRLASCAMVVAVVVMLAGCASPYDVLVATNAGEVSLGDQSVRVSWKNSTTGVKIIKQEKTSGPQQPTITSAEEDEASMIGRAVLISLSSYLAKDVSQKMGHYVATRRQPRYELVLELASNLVNTQGTRETVVIAHLHEVSQPKVLWARSIKITAPRRETENELVPKFSGAIIEQMKASKLII
ncbi:hypothetical protein [Pseudoduganella sp. RAF53_2]|uniref:hypothetical protein n=1 Tax=unclassified Pseudoduganella TaxID=2637179 RepID=UPI003F993931